MPVSFRFDEASTRFETTVTGEVTPTAPVRHLQDILRHRCCRPDLKALVICERVSVADYDVRAVLKLIRYTREIESRIENARVAVVTNQPVVAGFLRLFRLYRDPPFAFEIFGERVSAIEWLESKDGSG